MGSTTSTSVGYLSPQRLNLIPQQFHARHEFLIYLFVQIQDLVISMQEQVVRGFSFKPDEIPGFEAEAFAADPIGYAAKSCPQAKEPILFDVALALSADFMKFVHHALIAFENREFAVGYANLRKPLKENLPLLCWLCADSDEFFSHFLADPVSAFNSGALSPQKRQQIFEKALQKNLPFSKVPWDAVEKFIFSKDFTHGLSSTFDKATHLVTSKGHMRTEEMNLNFIFKDPRDNDVYETDYCSISLILLYSLLVLFSAFERLNKHPKNYELWMYVAVWGAYEAIFQGRTSEMLSSFEKTCTETVCCMYCKTPLALTPTSIPKAILTERLGCAACEREQPFPLQWLFCHEANEQNRKTHKKNVAQNLAGT